jgi:hypothetical protein
MSAINIEAMLLSWAETSNGGAKIVLQLADADDLEPFKRMTLAKGKQAGQRLGCAFVEIGDDEKPVERRKHGAGPLAQLAGRWCEDVAFQHWLEDAVPTVWAVHWDPARLDETAARVVRMMCGVASRSELDTNPTAGRTFHKLIREPFSEWLGARK